jgi:NodT family efflux transporter outer membrane factor (OMF) lipoprotein
MPHCNRDPTRMQVHRHRPLPAAPRDLRATPRVETEARVFALAASLAACVAVALGGCAVGPDYKRPGTAMAASYREAPPGWKVAAPADHADRGPWWSVYNDARLDSLMNELNTANQSVAQFAAAYRQARALVAEARAAYFPTLGLTASATRSGQQLSSSSNFASSSGSRALVSNSFNLTLDATWEPDLWGRISRTVSAQRAGEQAAAADLGNARLSAQATLAQTYYQLRELDSLQKLFDNTVAAFAAALKLTQNQYAQGVAARADVIQAQTQLQSAQAAAIDNGVARAQNEHAIAVLVGQPASTFSIPPIPLDVEPPQLPLEVPSALLERRPDIAAAERRAAAANEQIGIAIAAYFPTLTLSATGGYQNSVFSNLFTLPSRFWTVGPSLAETLFNAGLRRAQTDAARAAYDLQVALYRQTVLAAFQNVEDNLASQRILAEEIVVQRQTVDSARQALAIVTNQYKSGIVAYVNVLVAQTTAFTAEQRLATLAGERMLSSVGLVKALGGSWDVRQMNRETGSIEAPAPASREPDAARQRT